MQGFAIRSRLARKTDDAPSWPHRTRRESIRATLLLTLLIGAIVAPGVTSAQTDRTFRLRAGVDGNESKHLFVGANPATRNVTTLLKIRRYRGQDTITVDLVAEIVEGRPEDWTFTLSTDRVVVGPGPSRSIADADGDGDVDDDDYARLWDCVSGSGIVYADVRECLHFDFDGDLDVDGDDDAQFQVERTGPRSFPVTGLALLTVQSTPALPEGDAVTVRVTATNPATGESHSLNVHATKRSRKLTLDRATGPELTLSRENQLAFGEPVSFEMDLRNIGADLDVALMTAVLPAGFTAEFVNESGAPQRLYAVASVGSAAALPSKRSVRIDVTSPPGWRERAEAPISVFARSLLNGETVRQDVTITNAGIFWTASDLLAPAGRRHRIRAGSRTTHVLTITNNRSEPHLFLLFAVQATPPMGFALGLERSSVALAAGEQTEIEVSIAAPAESLTGSFADWYVVLTDATSLGAIDANSIVRVVRVGATIANDYKLIQIGIDGFPPQYLGLDRAGTSTGSDGDWLMPNLRNFMGSATTYTNARVLLPAVTDANHVNALTGSLTGTSGASSVIYYYLGEDEDNAAVLGNGDESMLRFGATGEEIQGIFDVAKAADPDAHTAMVLGKNWVARYFSKGEGGVDVVANGFDVPLYVDPPVRYTLGDPPSDADAATDPPAIGGMPEWGNFPGLYPDDRWVFAQAQRIIRHEDPDVLYIQPAHPDDVQHLMGSAFEPSEWDDRGTATTWDDTNRVHPLSTREEVLDVMRELDLLFGELIDFLRDRGTLDETYIVVHADHGFTTQAPATVAIQKLLEPEGFSAKDHYYVGGGGGFVLIYDVDPAEEAAFEAALEEGASIAPGEVENPFVVINRTEMQTGVDQHTGEVWGLPNELYSEFFIEHPDPEPVQQHWPSFFVFLKGHWQGDNILIQSGEDDQIPLFIGSHGGFASQHVPLIVRGPMVPEGAVVDDEVYISDIAPTLYFLQGWNSPPNVDGRVLPNIQGGALER